MPEDNESVLFSDGTGNDPEAPTDVIKTPNVANTRPANRLYERGLSEFLLLNVIQPWQSIQDREVKNEWQPVKDELQSAIAKYYRTGDEEALQTVVSASALMRFPVDLEGLQQLRQRYLAAPEETTPPPLTDAERDALNLLQNEIMALTGRYRVPAGLDRAALFERMDARTAVLTETLTQQVQQLSSTATDEERQAFADSILRDLETARYNPSSVTPEVLDILVQHMPSTLPLIIEIGTLMQWADNREMWSIARAHACNVIEHYASGQGDLEATKHAIASTFIDADMNALENLRTQNLALRAQIAENHRPPAS